MGALKAERTFGCCAGPPPHTCCNVPMYTAPSTVHCRHSSLSVPLSAFCPQDYVFPDGLPSDDSTSTGTVTGASSGSAGANFIRSLRRRVRSQRELHGLDAGRSGRPNHCSAAIVIEGTPGAGPGPNGEPACGAAPADIHVTHATWASYETMTRIMKTYIFPWRRTGGSPASDIVPASSIAFSSYPATLYSSDDIYIASPSRLIVTETTLDNVNSSLWQYVTPQSVLCWMRAMVATRLATDAPSWSGLFLTNQSGTYNNAWCVASRAAAALAVYAGGPWLSLRCNQLSTSTFAAATFPINPC